MIQDIVIRGTSRYISYRRADGSPAYATLYNADLSCDHDVRAKELWEGGGVTCRKCEGWFCY